MCNQSAKCKSIIIYHHKGSDRKYKNSQCKIIVAATCFLWRKKRKELEVHTHSQKPRNCLTEFKTRVWCLLRRSSCGTFAIVLNQAQIQLTRNTNVLCLKYNLAITIMNKNLGPLFEQKHPLLSTRRAILHRKDENEAIHESALGDRELMTKVAADVIEPNENGLCLGDHRRWLQEWGKHLRKNWWRNFNVIIGWDIRNPMPD